MVVPEIAINSVLASISSSLQGNSNLIKSIAQFSTFYTGYGWYGSLTELPTTSMYKIKLEKSVTATFRGAPVSLIAVNISSGWNWLPCMRQEAAPIDRGLATHSKGYTQGDTIKSMTQFTQYYDGYGWFGSLTTLSPGNGYMLKVAIGGEVTLPV